MNSICKDENKLLVRNFGNEADLDVSEVCPPPDIRKACFIIRFRLHLSHLIRRKNKKVVSCNEKRRLKENANTRTNRMYRLKKHQSDNALQASSENANKAIWWPSYSPMRAIKSWVLWLQSCHGTTDIEVINSNFKMTLRKQKLISLSQWLDCWSHRFEKASVSTI